MEKLEERGATVDYNDPYIPVVQPTREHGRFTGKKSVDITSNYDLILISTAHDVYKAVDFSSFKIPIVDTRNLVKTAFPLLFKA
jgi:UDP-N-acetyl-D-glucosamine dehydrogenase